MKKCTVMPLLGIVIALLMTLGCTPTTVVGSGPVMTHGGDSGPFHALDVSDAFTVHVTKSDKCRAHVRINKNLFRYYFMENSVNAFFC